MTRRPRPPSPVEEAPRPPRVEEGIVGAVRSLKKLRGARGSKSDPRRKTVEKIREYMGRNAPEVREVPSPFEGSIYGDDDESEN
jgi:hypothetical protein